MKIPRSFKQVTPTWKGIEKEIDTMEEKDELELVPDSELPLDPADYVAGTSTHRVIFSLELAVKSDTTFRAKSKY